MEEQKPAPPPPNPPDGSTRVKIPPGSLWAEELQQFEQFPTAYAPTPGNPYVYRPFPKMVYKAGDWMGKIASHAVAGPSWEFKSTEEMRRAEASAEEFTKTCQRIVKDEAELQAAYEAGYRGDPVEAVEFAKARADAISRGAAERHHSDLRMSEKAQREAAAADAETAEHLPEIPEKPVRRRGRPKGSKNKPRK
jgi:hypothetical protein